MEDIQKQVAELLEQAMKQPGVTEIMQLCEKQKMAMDAHANASQAIAPRWIVSSSTSAIQELH